MKPCRRIPSIAVTLALAVLMGCASGGTDCASAADASAGSDLAPEDVPAATDASHGVDAGARDTEFTEISDHPALAASQRSWSAVHRKAKEEWLALFAPDAVVEDPVGPSILDPTGDGHQGIAEISQFWDTNIGPNQVTIEMHESFPAGNEVAHRGTITTVFGPGSPFGEGSSIRVEGIFVYKVNDEGLLTALRGFWDFDAAMSTLTRP